MALLISCGNRHQVFVPDCAPECAAINGAHLAGCPGADLDSLLQCPPGEGCCEEDHHHGESGNNCPLMGTDPDHHHALGKAETVDNADCGVCRPITITFYSAPGAAPNIGMVNQ